jgi:hypothetical protein
MTFIPGLPARLAGGLILLFGGALTLCGQSNGYLKTSVNPGRAGVFIDGKYVGPAANFKIARKYPVPAGSHEVKLVDPRFEEYSGQVTIEAGKTTKLSQTLKPITLDKPPFGRIRIVHQDKFAAVYVNDKFYGHADEFNNPWQGILIKPGEYDVRIEPTSGSPVSQHVKVEADKVTTVK